MGTLLEKQIRATRPTKLTLWVRPGLEDYCRRHILPNLPCPTEVNTPLGDEPVLLLSGRTLHLTPFEFDDAQSVVIDPSITGPVIRQAWVHDPGMSPADLFNRTPRWLRLQDLPHSMPQSRLPQYIWDLISWNEEAIVTDSVARQQSSQPLPTGPYHVIEPSNLWIGQNVKLGPGCVLDGSKGPIVLSDDCVIGANAVLQGPVYVGPYTQISPLASIRPGVSLGSMCKVGGEVSNTIVMSFTNKPHEGFLGDSYLGEWVNLGAGATTSNLKNTYSQISMSLGGEPIETGRRFLGSLVGDHTKVAIGTRLMTGSYIGYNSMVAVSQYPPKFVPSFTFLTDAGSEPYRMDKAAAAMKEVFNRRQRDWTDADEAMNHFALETARSIEGATEH